ncbi:MAG: UDP-glucose 4-epimerase GalE [Desulfococcaceae bacterium]|nr:UDP-glucose 4-epimerase GalE [Desulfococcaceae bacterium]
MKKNILVAGGAGYIGSHMCKYLFKKGFSPVVLDNLMYGHPRAVKWGPLIQGDISDSALLDHVFSEYDFAGVMYFAAFINVGESVTDPAKYYQNNVGSAIHLLEAMQRHGAGNLIFSSSCAVYGEPREIPLTETHPCHPINPYGRSKLMVEQILSDFDTAYGMKYTSLRYFNAAGADPDGELGEDHSPETHLIPLIFQTILGKRNMLSVFGNDYPSKDGTCIRDYIHINDLARAHLLALERLLDGGDSAAYNLGNGAGYSVKEVIDMAEKVSGKAIPCEIKPRRAGDPPVLIGSAEKAVRELGWKPEFPDLESIMKTAWDWHRTHPEGYR